MVRLRCAVTFATILLSGLIVGNASAARCKSLQTAVHITANRQVFCEPATDSAPQMISTYAVLKSRFTIEPQLGGEFFDWTCSVNASDPVLFRIRCSSTRYAIFRTSIHGRAAMSFDWRTGPYLDAHRCGQHTIYVGASTDILLSGTSNPGESCLDLNSFFKQLQESGGGGYPSPPSSFNPAVNSTVDQHYTVHLLYRPDVLMPCRLGRSIILCRPNNGDLAPAGRYDCAEHFIATTVVDQNGMSTTMFQDRWRCERTQRMGRFLIRDEVLTWSDLVLVFVNKATY